MLKLVTILALVACALAYREFILKILENVFIKYFTADRSDRIVGGQNAALGQIASQVSLRSWGTGNVHFAGGVLISSTWVLTTAESVSGRANDSINIALGIVVLPGSFTNRRSNLITAHEGYNRLTRENK